MRTLRLSLVAALVGTAALSGCNVFEGLYDAASSSDPDVLLSSAQSALQQGDATKAVDLYKKALDAAPAGSEAKALAADGYATASFEQAGVSVLLFDRISQDLTKRFTNGAVAPLGKASVEVCSFAPPERAGEQINLNTIDGYPALKAAAAQIATTRQTLAAAFSLPANPGPAFNVGQFTTSLRTQGLSDRQISSVLLNLTFAYAASSFDRIAKAGGDQIRWFEVFPTTGDSYLGYCAPSQALLNEVKRETSCSLGDIGFGVALLKERARLYPGGMASDLVTGAEDAYKRLSDEIGTSCTG